MPSGCAAFRRSVFEYVDGEADESTEIVMEQHSRECPRCLAVLRAAVQLTSAVARAELPAPAPRALRVRVAQLLADLAPPAASAPAAGRR
ncbi:MAG: zf-HC2 domain-containing protein [Gemmatimonadaceae bacterium]|nr:zf-HC2 domain-containing protein [Gemmatimonadaceae bacterium]